MEKKEEVGVVMLCVSTPMMHQVMPFVLYQLSQYISVSFPNINTIMDAVAVSVFWISAKQVVLYRFGCINMRVASCIARSVASSKPAVQKACPGAHCFLTSIDPTPHVCRCGGGVSTRACVLMKPKQRLELPRQGCLPQISLSNPPLMLTTTRTATATWNLPLMQLSAGSCCTPCFAFLVFSMLPSVKAEVLCHLMLSERLCCITIVLYCHCVQVDRVKLWPIYWHQSVTLQACADTTFSVLSCHVAATAHHVHQRCIDISTLCASRARNHQVLHASGRPVMDPNGFDHDDGMNAFTVEKSTVIRKKGVYVGGAPAYLMTQVHKERDLFSVVVSLFLALWPCTV